MTGSTFHLKDVIAPKGQIISEWLLDVFIWTKKRTKIFLCSCPSLIFSLIFFVEIKTSKSHSEINWLLSSYKLRELKKSTITRNNSMYCLSSSLMKCFCMWLWLLTFNFTKQNSTYFSACSLRRFSKNWAMLSFGLSFSAPVHAKVWSVSITEDPVRLCRCWLFESSWKP